MHSILHYHPVITSHLTTVLFFSIPHSHALLFSSSFSTTLSLPTATHLLRLISLMHSILHFLPLILFHLTTVFSLFHSHALFFPSSFSTTLSLSIATHLLVQILPCTLFFILFHSFLIDKSSLLLLPPVSFFHVTLSFLFPVLPSPFPFPSLPPRPFPASPPRPTTISSDFYQHRPFPTSLSNSSPFPFSSLYFFFII